MASLIANPVNRNTLKIINKYRLDIKNAFHLRAAQKIVEEFLPHQNADYEIKLNNRMKLGQGNELHLLPNQSLLPRRDPVYLKDVIPLKTAFILYGVDRMSNKDLQNFVYDKPTQSASSQQQEEVVPSPEQIQQVAQSAIKKKSLQFTRLDTSHFGIVLLKEQGKEILKNLFEDEKSSIFNVLKEVESEDEEKDEENVNPITKKLPRGWFSIKSHDRFELCIRYATSNEFVEGKWAIKTSPLEEEMILRVNLLANTLESNNQLQSEMGTLADVYSKRSRLASNDFRSPFTRNGNERSRSRQRITRRSETEQKSPLNFTEEKQHIIRGAQDLFAKKDENEKEPKEKLSRLKEEQNEDDLSERLSRMSCDDKPEEQAEKENIVNAIAEQLANNEEKDKNKDSDMASEGEIDLNELLGTPSNVKPSNSVTNNAMVEESAENHDATDLLKKEKLVNSFNGLSSKDTLAQHPDIYKIKKIQKFRVEPGAKFNYSKYIQQRELEERLQRRRMKIRRREIKNIAKVSSKMVDENQSIPIVNLISEDEGPIRKIGKEMPETSGNQEFEAMDGMPIPQCAIQDTFRGRPRNFVRRTQQKVIVHYERKMSEAKSVQAKNNKSKASRSKSRGSRSHSAQKQKAASKSPSVKKNKSKSKGPCSNLSHSVAQKNAKSVAKNSSIGSRSPASRKNEPQSTVKARSPFLFVHKDEKNQKPQEERRSNRFQNDDRNQNRFSVNQRGNFESRNNDRPNFRRDNDKNGGERNFQRKDGQNGGFQRRDGQSGGFQRRDGQNGGFQRRNDQNGGGYQRRNDQNNQNMGNERKGSFDRKNEEKPAEKMKNLKAEESDDGGIEY